jgi:squalene-hopene/tetraprenyl-beta-curcumene cyclase
MRTERPMTTDRPHRARLLAALNALAATALLAATAAAQVPPGGAPLNQQQQLAQQEREIAAQVAVCPVKATPALLDAGFVQPHTVVKVDATLVNPLDRPVRCIKSAPTCTCTTVDMVGKEIPAKGSITVPVSMKTSGATGEKTAAVRMMFDGVPGVVEVKLRAEVTYPVRAWQLNPGRDGKPSKDPFINAFDFKQNVAGEITVESLDGKPFSVLSVGGLPPVFAGFDPAKDGPRESYRVRYDFSKLACQDVPKYLVVETDRPDARLIDLRVRHECTRISPAFNFEQYRENLGVLAPGAGRDFELLIKMANGVRIDRVDSLDPRLDAQLVGQRADTDALATTVRVTAKPTTQGMVLAALRFTGVGPDPRQPVPPGQPAATAPRQADFLVYVKVEPTKTDAKPAVAPGAVRGTDDAAAKAPAAGTSRGIPAAVREAIVAPATVQPGDTVNTKKITMLDDPSVPARVVQPLPVVMRIAARPEEVPMDAARFAKAKDAIERGLAFLRGAQGPNGGWMESTAAAGTDQAKASQATSAAVTGLVLKAFAQAGYPAQRDAKVAKALEFVAQKTDLRGTFTPDAGGGLSNYVASLVLMGLAAQDDPALAGAVGTVREWIVRNQWDQAEGLGPRTDWFGGAGYGSHGRPDMSNTQLMLDALHDAGVSPDDPAVQRALVFVARAQNVKTNTAAWAQHGTADGGFVYTPANGGESFASDAAGEGRYGEKMPEGTRALRSYGSMTYAGFKSMLYAGLAPDDPRVKAAFDWIRAHYTFAENPGLGQQGLWYYLHAASRALLAANATTIVPAAGGAPRNWRDDLVDTVLALQRTDGSWVNTADRWQEGKPELVTAYAVLALEEALKPVLRAQ